jgi:bacterioferritin-associated ferredoxin
VIVCHCRGVTDRAIREAVRDGARTLRQVARACDAGARCGGCRPAIAELIDDEGPCASTGRIALRVAAAVAAS